MADVKNVTTEEKKTDKLDLPKSIFAIEPNMGAIYSAVRAFQANQRRGTASSKGRSDVSGGGIKPWRQKGTGRARAGTIRSPLWVGGGVIFGPKPRDYSYAIPRKEKRLATKSALALKAQDDKVRLIEDPSFEFPKTRKVAEILENLGIIGHRSLMLVNEYDEKLFLSARNIKELKIIKSSQANAYQVLWAEYLIITKSGLGALEEVFGR